MTTSRFIDAEIPAGTVDCAICRAARLRAEAFQAAVRALWLWLAGHLGLGHRSAPNRAQTA